MAQRLTLSVDEEPTLTNLKQFIRRAEEIRIPGSTKIRWSEDEGSHMVTLPIPSGAVVSRRVVRRKITKKEARIKEAATEQIKARKEAVAKKEPVPGHVGPVKGVKRTKRKRTAKKSSNPGPELEKKEKVEAAKKTAAKKTTRKKK